MIPARSLGNGTGWSRDVARWFSLSLAPLTAVNSADDLINPPDLGILERQITRVKNGKAVVIPESEQTRGHGTHTLAAVWKEHLEELLKRLER